jgi:hypothetical protein
MISLLKLQLEDQIVAKKGEKKYYIDKNGSVIECLYMFTNTLEQ